MWAYLRVSPPGCRPSARKTIHLRIIVTPHRDHNRTLGIRFGRQIYNLQVGYRYLFPLYRPVSNRIF